MTAQNHEVQVVGDSLPAAAGFHVSQVNLNDGSVEGLRHRELPIETVQYHPEGAPGPLDALAVFDRFVAACGRRAPGAPRSMRRPGAARRPCSSSAPGPWSSARRPSSTTPARRPAARSAPRASGRSWSTPNPATIMTDAEVADAVYLEPLTVEAIEAVIAKERPEGLLAGLGGQTALNLAVALAKAGVLEQVQRPAHRHAAGGDRDGRGPRAVPRPARPDRPAVRAELHRRGRHGRGARRGGPRGPREIGLPAIIRPAFTLGGTGGGIVETEEAYWERTRAGLRLSPIHQVMIERCLVGWQEIEYEVMRDADDTCIAVCSMENVDPLGVHTGDSIVVAPVQTLPDPVHQRLRSAALAIIRALGVEGGCNVQFALSPDSTDYAVIEVNPRVSRSSALASKATGYPIARVAAQIAVGRRLAEIPNVVTGTTVAAFEPALDYVVVKLPRFPFDKFPTADRTLGSQMKATGEVMAIDRTFGSALNKALRALEQAGAGFLAENGARPRSTT